MKQVIYKERKQTDCVKWDGCKEKFGMEELLPLWVADMDFEAPVCVKEALKNYVDFGVYGYYQPPKAYFEAFENWEEKYHDYKVELPISRCNYKQRAYAGGESSYQNKGGIRDRLCRL